MRPQLVLSLFPGLDLLGQAFERTGFCVVQGPDIIWGRSIVDWTPPAGRFDGVIGGPPCPSWSRLRHLIRAQGHETAPDMMPEFVRCVAAARPAWWVMELTPDAPVPEVTGYEVWDRLINARHVPECPDGAIGCEQNRVRRFSFGVRADVVARIDDVDPWRGNAWRHLRYAALDNPRWAPAVMAAGNGSRQLVERHRPQARGGITKVGPSRETVAEALRLQGLPADLFAHSPYTVAAQQRLVGNGVPLPMGLAVAQAVRRWLETTDGC